MKNGDVPLEPRVMRQLEDLGTVDLLVGIPSYNNADTIAHVVRAAAAGLAKYFPGRSAVIVNSDGGSSDGTAEVVAKTELQSPSAILVSHPVSPAHKIVTPYSGIPGKGSAFRTVFAIAERLEARACAVVDSDLRSIRPEWFELLLGPIVAQDFDYVAPMYLRHKFDGTITNSIVYPLTRALYGREVRQPIGGEFGFSGRLAGHYLKKPVWESNVARFGIDIWMTTTAIADGFKVCESFLGAKIHDPKDPGADLADMLVQVVSAVFDLMETYEDRWKEVEGAEDVPLFGFPHDVGLEPVKVNVGRMVRIFRQGVRDLAEVWARALDEATLAEVTALGDDDREAFCFPDSLWVRVVFDYALAYRQRALNREQLLRSLVPLYLGRTASVVVRNMDSGAEEVEASIRALADTFVGEKGYLRERWT